MESIIKNEYLKIVVEDKGAELFSIYGLKNKKEYLWQGDPTYWGRRAPVLFPIIGRLKDDEYIYQDKTYNLNQHGLARDLTFEKIKETQDSLKFLLKYNKKTLQRYPFKFILKIGYTLNGNEIQVAYKVFNEDDKSIYFSIGAHPGFNCNLHKEDMSLLFKNTQILSSKRLNGTTGLLKRETELIMKNKKRLKLNYTLFEKDALIFENNNINEVTLKENSEDILTLSFKGFPYLGIWTRNEAPFICIEPWYGLADEENTNKHIETKKGIIKLEPNEMFEAHYKIKIYL